MVYSPPKIDKVPDEAIQRNLDRLAKSDAALFGLMLAVDERGPLGVNFTLKPNRIVVLGTLAADIVVTVPKLAGLGNSMFGVYKRDVANVATLLSYPGETIMETASLALTAAGFTLLFVDESNRNLIRIV